MSHLRHLLITNDDGYHAAGLQKLASVLSTGVRVTIVAPDREKSAVSHGITMHHPLRAIMVGPGQWMIDGTPADCVKLALEHLLRENPPDLVLSGINHGLNLGHDVRYSGTVAAMMEGSLHQIPAIAISAAAYGHHIFQGIAEFMGKHLDTLFSLARQAPLNMNFPSWSEPTLYQVKGIRFTSLGIRLYRNVFERRLDPRGREYFWMGGEPMLCEQATNSDIQAVTEGYVSITPLSQDWTNFELLKQWPDFPET